MLPLRTGVYDFGCVTLSNVAAESGAFARSAFTTLMSRNSRGIKFGTGKLSSEQLASERELTSELLTTRTAIAAALGQKRP